MSGRANSAPLLRRKDPNVGMEMAESDEPELCILREVDQGRDVVVPEAEAHDIARWPHMYPSEMQARMFPTAVAAPEFDLGEDGAARDEFGQLHRRWAAHKISVTRG